MISPLKEKLLHLKEKAKKLDKELIQQVRKVEEIRQLRDSVYADYMELRDRLESYRAL